MARYPAELKASVIQKMMPPHNIPVAQLERETGISNVTLYTWRKQAREQGAPVPSDGKNPEQCSTENRFAVLLETAALNRAELSEYCRSKGLYPVSTPVVNVSLICPLFISSDCPVSVSLH